MYLLRRAAARALQPPSATRILRPRTFTSKTRAPAPLLSSREWATLPIQRRFASGQTAEQLTPDQVTSDPEAPSHTEAENVAESSPTHAEGAAAIGSTSTAESVVPEAEVVEETPVAERAKDQASGSSSSTSGSPIESNTMRQDLLQNSAPFECAPTNETLASAAATAGASNRTFRPADSYTPSARQQGEAGIGAIAPNTTLYVGNLYFEVSEDALQRQFASFGKILKTRIVYDHRGLSKGFGYIEFESQADADAAIAAMNQAVFQGRRMAVQYHRRRPPPNLIQPRSPNQPSKTLFIGNMSFEMSDKDLNDLFREVRNVVDVRVAIDRRTGQPRGFAHADFIDVDSASRAKQHLEAKEVYGRKLRVDFSRSSAQSTPR